MENKQLLFSVTKKDLRIDYYRGTGKGGQKRNKTENCCRITHLESGAVGKSEEGRSKEHNKRLALERMIATEEFQKWHKIKVAEKLGITAQIEQEVNRSIYKDNLMIEGKDENGLWVKMEDQ
jgi:protein subunit release factor B